MKGNTQVADRIIAKPGRIGAESNTLSRIVHLIGVAVGIGVFTMALYIVHRELKTTSFEQIALQLQSYHWPSVLLAALFTLLSYFSLTNFDRLGLSYIGRSLPARTVLSISFSAFTVGHNVGVSAVSAGSIRYRAYSLLGLSAVEIASIIAFCSITFAVGGALLFGTVLLTQPISTLTSLGIPTALVKLLACLLLALPLAYFAAVFFLKDGIGLKGIKIPLPSPSIAVQQIFFSSLDLLAAAAVLYFLIPPDAGITYSVLLSAYLLATLLGVISNIPGGVGVFEGTLLLLIPSLPKAELLGAIIIYRIIYYILPLFAAITLLTKKEISLHRHRLSAMAKQGRHWVRGFAPQVIGLMVFISGGVLLVSGSLPGNSSRRHSIEHILPLSFLEISHMLNSAVGVGLLIVARGLYQRLRGAYYFALLLVGAGIVVSLGKGLDIEESIVLTLVGALLFFCRAEFYRPAALIDSRFTMGWIISIAAVLGATLWIGLFVHQHVEYRDSLWWKFTLDANAPRMLRGMLVATVVIAAFGIFRLTRAAAIAAALPTIDDLEKAKAIVAQSVHASSNIALLGDKRLLFHPEGDAFIMYQIAGNTWLAMGDPVGNPTRYEALVWRFRELSHRHGSRCAFYQVRTENLAIYVDLGLSLSKLGEEARVPLPQFSLEGSHNAKLRQALHNGRRSGAVFQIIPARALANVIEALKVVSDEWLASKISHEKGFSLGNFTPKYLLNFDCAVLKLNGEIVAFANLWSSDNKHELSIDLMRYSKAAPTGIMDYLFVELILWGQQNAYQWFSLGMAPLSSLEKQPLAPLWHKAGNGIFRLGDNVSNFDGLRKDKEKFHPQWEPLYLAAPGGLALARVLMDSTLLISGGLKGLFAK